MIGTIKIKIECLNSSKIINTLVDNGVFLKNLKERYKYIVFEIDERDEEKFRMICKKHHKHFDVISKNNIFRLVKKSRFYFGCCVALSLVVSFVYCFNVFAYSVCAVDGGNLLCRCACDWPARFICGICRDQWFFP